MKIDTDIITLRQPESVDDPLTEIGETMTGEWREDATDEQNAVLDAYLETIDR